MTEMEKLRTAMINANRFNALMARHIRAEDAVLSDRGLVLKAYERYKRYLDEALVDVSE